MKKNNNNTLLYKHKWHWPLPFKEKLYLNAYMDKLLGINTFLTEKERWNFINSLQYSLSLDIGEKQQVINHFETLSEFQITELLNVFKEEREKFTELEKEHPEDIRKLMYKSLIEWGRLINKDNGEYVFMEKIIKTDEYQYVHYILDVLEENKSYLSIFVLTKNIIKNSEINNNELGYIYNYYIYSIMFSHVFKNDFIKKIEKLLYEIDLLFSKDKKYSFFLKISTFNYASNAYGFYSINNSFFPLIVDSAREEKSIKHFSYSLFSKYKMFKGDQYGCLKNSLKKWNVLYSDKINKESITKILDNNNIDIEKFYDNMHSLILYMYISNFSCIKNLTIDVSCIIYDSISKKIKLSEYKYIKMCLFFEIILKKNDFSSNKNILLYIEKTNEKDLKFLHSITVKLTSFDSFIDKSKEVIKEMDTYSDIMEFVSYISIYLSINSNDIDVNLFIINSIEKQVKSKGIKLGSEFDIFRNLIEEIDGNMIIESEFNSLNRFLDINR